MNGTPMWLELSDHVEDKKKPARGGLKGVKRGSYTSGRTVPG